MPSFCCNLPCRVLGFPANSPGGAIRLFGETPGDVNVPEGYDCLISPTDTSAELLDDYGQAFCDGNVTGVLLDGVRDRSWFSSFCERNPQLRHIALVNSRFSSDALVGLEGLRCLEFRDDVLTGDIRFIEHVEPLRCLVIVGCNNVFSAGVPKSDNLVELLISSVATLVNLDELVEHVHERFPSLERLHLNRCGHAGRRIDLASIAQLPRLRHFEAIGTRAVDPDGQFEIYFAERQALDEYLDGCSGRTRRATFEWSFTHNQDIADLAEKSPGIEELRIVGSEQLNDLAVLQELEKLKSLSVIDCPSITSLYPLGGLVSLRRLEVASCRGIRDFACLARCRQLKSLSIARSPDSTLPYAAYKNQILELHLGKPPGCQISCDIPEEEIVAMIEEIPQFMAAVKEELEASC